MVIIARRHALRVMGGALVAPLFPGQGNAQVIPYEWTTPGEDPFLFFEGITPAERVRRINLAFGMLSSLPQPLPLEAALVLNQRVQNELAGRGRTGIIDTIPNGLNMWMVFGTKSPAKMRWTVAQTRQWAPAVPRSTLVYRWPNEVRPQYVILVPEVCGNIAMTTPQLILECLTGEHLCRENCT